MNGLFALFFDVLMIPSPRDSTLPEDTVLSDVPDMFL